MSLRLGGTDRVVADANNQPVPPAEVDLWNSDIALREAVLGFGGQDQPLSAFGAALGGNEMRDAARAANRTLPELVRFDRGGRRVDVVRFHPAYHEILTLGVSSGYSALAWQDNSGGHVTHAAMVYLQSQVEPGAACPMTMTYAAYPLLEGRPDLRSGILSRTYDRSRLPIGSKKGVTFGMAMTEKQGGSDIRSNTTRAEQSDDGYRLYGHKWFCSAPMSDAFLTLAQAKGGLTCFLVPRYLPDGTLNDVHLMRLKEKLGNRSNASAEIEYHGAWAEPVGEEGDGVRQIIKMVHHTRLDTAMAPAGLMRAALAEAYWWCANRSAFQKRLVDQPLMRSVLADLALEWEGATALGLRVARAFDDPDQSSFARVSVALTKFWSNKRCPNFIYEAMECLGGMGYTDDTPMPLLYREAPLNSIWEGSGNVICLDILRTLIRDPDAYEQLNITLDASRGADRRFDAALTAHRARWKTLPPEAEARLYVERLAILLTAAVLIANGNPAVADGYIGAWVCGERGAVAGALSGLDTDAILARIYAEDESQI